MRRIYALVERSSGDVFRVTRFANTRHKQRFAIWNVPIIDHVRAAAVYFDEGREGASSFFSFRSDELKVFAKIYVNSRRIAQRTE